MNLTLPQSGRCLGAVLAAILVSACGDHGVAPVAEQPRDARVILSDTSDGPSAGPASAVDRSSSGMALSSVRARGVAYVSLPPGSVPGGVTAGVRNLRSGLGAEVSIFDGGLGPVALPAEPGDTIRIETRAADGSTRTFMHVVPVSRPPRVVRTKPPRGKTSVPLNVRVAIVFSEPMDSRSLTAQSVRLRDDIETVPGTIVLDSMGLVALFTPSVPLRGGTRYVIAVSSDVVDLDGEGLEEAFSAEFTTDSDALLGAIRVRTETSGSNIDPDGYVVHANDRSWVIGTNGEVVISQVWAGSASVRLDGLALNCWMEGERERLVTVPSRDTVDVTFAVACGSGTGNRLLLSAVTVGDDVDPDGYQLTVWEGTALSNRVFTPTNGSGWFGIGSNGRLELAVARTSYGVELTEVAPNCVVEGPNPRTAVVTSADVTLAFQIACSAVTAELAIADSIDGSLEIVALRANGEDRRRLTSHPAEDLEPAWSPDGDRIAFRSKRGGAWEIHVMSADGSNVVRVTDTPGGAYSPTWSADGRYIAFARVDGIGVVEIGGAQVALTANAPTDREPAWSPDGSRIAFVRDGAIHVMRPDGSDLRRISQGEYPAHGSPAWAPDGQSIAFTRYSCTNWCTSDIHVMNADGSGEGGLTSGNVFTDGDHLDPAWDFEGKVLALATSSFEVHLFRQQGNHGWCCTTRISRGTQPSWRPPRQD